MRLTKTEVTAVVIGLRAYAEDSNTQAHDCELSPYATDRRKAAALRRRAARIRKLIDKVQREWKGGARG